MIANVSPARHHFEETHNTLKYANRAKNISTVSVQNAVDVDAHVSQYARIIEALRREVALLRSEKSGGPALGGSEADASSAAASESLPCSVANTEKSDAPQKSEFQMMRAHKELVKRISAIYEKMHAKDEARISAESMIAQNEGRADLLVKLVQRVNDSLSDALHGADEIVQSLSEPVLHAIDKLSLENVRLRHNVGEYDAAVERYHESIRKLAVTAGEELSLLYREKLEAAIVELDEKRANLINCWLVQNLKKRAETSSEFAELLVQSSVDLALNVSTDKTAETALAEFLSKAFALSLKDKKSADLFVKESNGSGEPWETYDDSVSECDVSLNYDSMSETESECGDAERVGSTENILDDLGDDLHFNQAFERALPGVGNIADRSFSVVTPFKKQPDDASFVGNDDPVEDDATPMARPLQRRDSVASSAHGRGISAMRSAFSSLTTTPVAPNRTKLLEIAAAAEPIKSLSSLIAQTEPRSTPKGPKRSLLPVSKSGTPQKLRQSEKPPTATAIPMPIRSTSKIPPVPGLPSVPRTLRSQGAIRPSSPKLGASKAKGAPTPAKKTRTAQIAEPLSTRVLRSAVAGKSQPAANTTTETKLPKNTVNRTPSIAKKDCSSESGPILRQKRAVSMRSSISETVMKSKRQK